MALRHFQSFSSPSALMAALNGILSAKGSPLAATPTGCTTSVAGTTVTCANSGFAEVQAGDRFYLSGTSTEFTVDSKTSDSEIELNVAAGVDTPADAGVWRTYRGDRIDASTIVYIDLTTKTDIPVIYEITEFSGV